MRSLILLAVVSVSLIMGCVAYAQEVILPTEDFLIYLIKSLGGIKGASALAVSAIVVQILVQFLKTELFGQVFKKVTGDIKLMIVSGLSMVAGIQSLMLVGGLDLGSAMIHSTTLTALTVLAHQIYKQFIAKE